MNYYLLTRIAYHDGERITRSDSRRDHPLHDLRQALTGSGELYFVYPEEWRRRRERMDWLVAQGFDHHYRIYDVDLPLDSAYTCVRYLLLGVPSAADAFAIRIRFDLLPISVPLDGLEGLCSASGLDHDVSDLPIWL